MMKNCHCRTKKKGRIKKSNKKKSNLRWGMVQEKTGDSNTTTPVIKTENSPPPPTPVIKTGSVLVKVKHMCCKHHYSSRNIFAVSFLYVYKTCLPESSQNKRKRLKDTARVSECPSHDFVSMSVQALTDDFPGLSLQQQVKWNALWRSLRQCITRLSTLQTQTCGS